MRQGTTLQDRTKAFVQRIETRFVITRPQDIASRIEPNGREIIGENLNPQSRRELHGQPTISGLCGSIYDGVDNGTGLPVIRYEDQATNNALSI